MSSYYLSLNKEAKDHKLDSIGLQVNSDDPYIDDTSKWKDDVTQWPSLEFGAIYVYLVDLPGPFTRDKMHAYRSLEAYNFFVNGWVQTCYHRRSGSGFTIIKARVMR